MSGKLDKLTSSLQNLRATVDKNKEERKKCSFGNDDVLLTKNLFAFLEDLINSLKKAKIERLPDIEQELRENERLTKEFIIEKIKGELFLNEKLSKIEKDKIMANLENDKAQNDIFNIVDYKNKQLNELIFNEKELALGKNLALDDKSLQNLIEDKTKDSHFLKANDIFESLNKQGATKALTETTAKQATQEGAKMLKTAVMRA